MTRLALLLRGINVGGNNKVAMSDLRDILAGLGYQDPKTLLNSGNAVVSTSDEPARAERRLRDALQERIGKRIEVMARTHDDLARAVAANPLQAVADDPKFHHVAFLLTAPPASALDGVDAADYEPDRWALVGRELFVWYANGLSNSTIPAGFFEKRLKTPATARNWNTVQKLLELTA